MLNVSDETYPHIIYLFKHMKGVEILGDNYTQEKANKKE